MPVPEHLHKARAFLQDARLCNEAVCMHYASLQTTATIIYPHRQTSLDAAFRFVAKIEGVIRGAAHS